MTNVMGEMLRRARKARGWSLAEESAVTGVPKPTLARWERGEAPRNLVAYLALLGSLGIEADALYRPGSYRVLQSFVDDGQEGVYAICAKCGEHYLLPLGGWLCPECGEDSLLPARIGNGRDGLATEEEIQRTEGAPTHSARRDPGDLKADGTDPGPLAGREERLLALGISDAPILP